MRVFVTGIAGFLGSNLAEALIRDGHSVSGCDSLAAGYMDNVPGSATFHQADCCDLAAMKRLIAGHEVVFHAAALAYEGLSVFSPHLVTRNVFDSSVAVFSACVHAGVRRVINLSSMARYGRHGEVPFREELHPRPVDPYGVAKLASEQTLEILADVHGFEHVTLVPHSVIGPRQKYDDPFRNVASIMINTMLRGNQPVIYGDGGQKRCFSDIRDVVPCLLSAMTAAEAVGQVINIGPDEEVVTILELAEVIAEVVGFSPLKPRFQPERPREVRFAACSSDKARRLLGYRTRFRLRQSIETLAEWIRQRGPREFDYHLGLEIPSDRCPRAWREKLLS